LNNKTIIIAGGGHAGIEAALAISRMGFKATIITIDPKAIGRMSCNPAIGGLAKGHLVKEIDALGGAMGFFADKSCLQFKTLNKSKGRAVWSPRAQVDKLQYANSINTFVKTNKNINIIKGEVVDFDTNHGAVTHVILRSKEKINCSALVITSGTFLNGLIHIGNNTFKAGRLGEKPSSGLTEALNKQGFTTGRLKTGTPPRLLNTSIDWSKTEISKGENTPFPFSINTERPFLPPNDDCNIVNTSHKTHDHIHKKIHQSAMFSGKIKGIGPRYCPSIEDKVYRFSDKSFHQLFLEPEWKNSKQIYLNGFSTSLPKETQISALKTIPAFTNVELIRPGYAIEYDYLVPSQLKRSLESKTISGLFSAGQINGTSGYEEAAAQGLMAGINACKYISSSKELVLSRDQAYIGVLIDDLTTKDINEPYRMFTSSAEHRLLLRPDTARLRLSPVAIKNTLLTHKQISNYTDFSDKYNYVLCLLNKEKRKENSIYKRILRGELSYNNLSKEDGFNLTPIEVLFSIETLIKYKGYILREEGRIKKTKLLEEQTITPSFSYNAIYNLSREAREKLNRLRPETLGQASRIAGVNPSDIASIVIAMSK
jgi:tRNA uridine 5-carboxymethylaminomethyl modification enzyme